MKIKAFLLAFLLLPLIAFSQNVNIGDILCTDGSTVSPEQFASSGKTAEGIVFYVDGTSGQGWAVSLEFQAVNTHWVVSEHYDDMYDIPELDNFEHSREAMYDLDGYSNTAIIRNAHGADWYPAAWSVDFDHGWYLPAAGQMRWLIAYMNEINTSLAIVHGTMFVFDRPRWYWTSTERTEAHAVVLSQTGSVGNYPKWNYIGEYEIGVRAIKTFTIQPQSHHIGEVVTTANGQEGIVYYVSPEDGAYWLVAMNDLPSTYIWGPNTDIADLYNYNANDQFVTLHGVHCGYDATSYMREVMGTSEQYASSLVDFANGWHIPSVGQLSKLYAALPFIEAPLADNGGTTLSDYYYWTSTECSSDNAWAINFGDNLYTEGFLKDFSKTSQLRVRAVWSETCNVEPPTHTLPDNILETACNNNTPIPFEGGQLLHQTSDNVHAYATPLCGDIDGDGIIDIVVPHYTSIDEDYRVWSNQIDIYSGNDLSLQSTISIPQEIYLVYHPYGIVRYPLENGEMQGAVIVLCNDGKLRSYSKSGQLLHTADVDPPCDGIPAFADFNNDGHPEVYIGNAIYDAATLKQLCVGPANGNKGLSYRGSPNTVFPHHANYAMSYAYNIFGNENLELICGNTIYNVNIVSRTNPALNSITTNKTITPPSGYPQDGHVSLADLDLDGEIDVVVTKDPTDDCVDDDTYFYAYKPSTGTILFNFSIYCRSAGFPAICNIDADPHPEIIYVDYLREVYNEKMHCLRYTTENGLTETWNIHHNDPSGLTTMVFFDFNRDEIPEIVYRDAYDLNIINGSDGTVLYSYPMRSGTAGEHAIVADVNSDGHAEILATGLLEDYYGNNGHGNLLMFGNSNWPNARPIWNQYAYNVTNVNEDLTIPSYCFNNATVFTAPDGTLRRPYNNFLEQAYYITPEGEPYNPDGTIEIDIDGVTCSTFTFNGITYDEGGLYEQTIESEEGCDTLYRIMVTITDAYQMEFTETICGEAYTWNGTTYTETGDYQQEFTSTDGCDSIIILHLNVFDAYDIALDTTVCGSFVWAGHEYTQSGHYEQAFVTDNGCDSVFRMDLTVWPYPEAIPAITGPQEIYVVTDLILGEYDYYIDSVANAMHYEWTLVGADWVIDATGTLCSLLVTTPGTATLKVKAWNGCGYTEQEIIIHAGFFDVDDNQAIPVSLYPNPSDDKVTLETEGIKWVKIHDLQGQLLKEWAGEATDKVELSLQGFASALYTVEVFTERGRTILKMSVIH